MVKKKTNEEYINQIKRIHSDKDYNFEYINYINNKTNIKIYCNIHKKIFYKRADSFLKSKSDCPNCVIDNKKKLKKSQNEILISIKKVWGNTYDYTKMNYISANIPITIICKKHGEFKKRIYQHVIDKQGCKKCKFGDTNNFIKKSKKFHKEKYDYSKTIFNGIKKPVTIICKKHGEFTQSTAISHLNGSGCPICKSSKGEKVISNYFSSNNIKYISQKRIIFLDELIIFDFYLPLYDLYIEFDGKQHFINSLYGKKDINHKKDIIKNMYIAHKNLKLLRIHYKDKKIMIDIIKQYLNTYIKNNIYFSRKNYYE